MFSFVLVPDRQFSCFSPRFSEWDFLLIAPFPGHFFTFTFLNIEADV